MDRVLPILLTVGHGTLAQAELGRLLTKAGVQHLVDVRIGPGSRRHPHVGRTQLERWLPDQGISYRWDKRLGGFRSVPADSPDVGLRNASFAGYAAHMRTATFGPAVAELLTDASRYRTAIMCSESVWWRCHRRLIADYVQLVRDVPVRHLMHDERLVAHVPTDAARLTGDRVLVYDEGTIPL